MVKVRRAKSETNFIVPHRVQRFVDDELAMLSAKSSVWLLAGFERFAMLALHAQAFDCQERLKSEIKDL